MPQRFDVASQLQDGNGFLRLLDAEVQRVCEFFFGPGGRVLRQASHRVVPVRVPFPVLILSGACSVKSAWLLSRGAMVSPFHQNQIHERVAEWERKVDRALGNIWDAITLPFALWRRV
jgi:hypothetical protein